jgi:hypothetical protein
VRLETICVGQRYGGEEERIEFVPGQWGFIIQRTALLGPLKWVVLGAVNSHQLGTSHFLSSHFHISDWPKFPPASHIVYTSLSSQLFQHSPEPDSVTLKMEAVHASKMSEHSTTTWCRNPKDDQQQFLRPIL